MTQTKSKMESDNKQRANRAYDDDGRQQDVDRHFATTAQRWKLLYEEKDLVGLIYQQRREVVLEMVRRLALPQDARILDIGCGAGLTAIALASRGFTVEAQDTLPEMLSLTRQNAAEAGVSDRVITGRGDIHHLRYPENSFDCVIAMGVLPWIHSPEIAVREMGRVVKPGGAVIVTADNRWRLNNILDPRFNPVVTPLKRAAIRFLDASGIRKRSKQGAWVNMHSRVQIDRYIASGLLERMSGVTVGFGPFSFLGKVLLPDVLGVHLHRRLQGLADRNVPCLRSTGAHYIILARKPGIV